MVEVEDIFDKTMELLTTTQILKGKRILITAGGTKEKIDPVRYITNCSSGKMGLALADCAYSNGAQVTLVSTFEVAKPYKNIVVQSACEMEKAVCNELDNQDCVIMTAAVADYRAANYSEQKIKKTSENEISIKLVKNPDILKNISGSNTLVVGFCAESENLIENAKKKIEAKGCDFLVANDISRNDIGFSSDMNEVYILDKNLNISHIEKDTKLNVARKILEKIFE
jgi:phosphopantothenoylcysteine decarboxylase/phosphopantothenate--cysteine ligase